MESATESKHVDASELLHIIPRQAPRSSHKDPRHLNFLKQRLRGLSGLSSEDQPSASCSELDFLPGADCVLLPELLSTSVQHAKAIASADGQGTRRELGSGQVSVRSNPFKSIQIFRADGILSYGLGSGLESQCRDISGVLCVVKCLGCVCLDRRRSSIPSHLKPACRLKRRWGRLVAAECPGFSACLDMKA